MRGLPRARSSGFLTLEILIALSVFVSALTAVVLLSGAQGASVTSVHSEALSVAREVLESQRALAHEDFNLVVATTSTAVRDSFVYSTQVSVRPLGLFTKKVSATVSWPDNFGRTRGVSLSALVTQLRPVGASTCSSVVTGDWQHPSARTTAFAALRDRSGNALDTLPGSPYPLTDVDAHDGRLYVSVATSSTLSGPHSPHAFVADPSTGTVPWTNMQNVQDSDSAYATAVLAAGDATHYLVATDFGFAIPEGATILGVRLDVARKGSSSANLIRDHAVHIVREGIMGATNAAATTNWPTASSYKTYGDAAYLWGEPAWNARMINSSAFGVAFAAAAGSGSGARTASVDHVRLTVYYTKQLYVFDLEDPMAPVFLGSLATSTLATGLNAIAVATSSARHYLYAATNASGGTHQLQVIDVRHPATPFAVSTFPASAGTGMGTGVGTSVAYQNGYVYAGLTTGVGPQFNIIDVSDPASPVWKGGYTVGATVNAIIPKGDTVYLSTNDTARELIVMDVSNPAAPFVAAAYNAAPDTSGFGYGRALHTVGNRAYLGRSWTGQSTTPQFYGLSMALPSIFTAATSTIGQNMSLRGSIVRDWLAYLLSGSGTSGGQLHVRSATSTAPWADPITLPAFPDGAGGVALDCEGNALFAASVDGAGIGYLTTVTAE